MNNVIYSGPARQVTAWPSETLNDGSDCRGACQPLYKFVGNIAGVERGKDQDVCPSCDTAVWRLPVSDCCDERSVTLKFAVDFERRHLCSHESEGFTDPIDARPAGTAHGAVRQQGDDRIIAYDASPVARGGDGYIRKLSWRRLRYDCAIGERQDLAMFGPEWMHEHVERGRHCLHALCGANGPQRTAKDIGGRVRGTCDATVCFAQCNQTIRKHQRVTREHLGVVA
jgi:hypothetical protein